MPVENKKILNARKIVVDGTQYDSRLEAHMAGLLKQFRIPFRYQVAYQIQPPFKYRNKKIRNVEIIVDFLLMEVNMIVDTKGHQTEKNKLQWKMLKYHFVNLNLDYDIRLPRTQKECQSLVNEILKSKETADGNLSKRAN